MAKIMIFHTSFHLSQMEQNIELVKVSGTELGFTQNVSRADIMDQAEMNFGLEPCQPEDGPYTRLSFLKQHYGEEVRMAMESIPVGPYSSEERIFYIGIRDGVLHLETHHGNRNHKVFPGDQWVFRRRK